MEEAQTVMPTTPENSPKNKSNTALMVALALALFGVGVLGALYFFKTSPASKNLDTAKEETTVSPTTSPVQIISECSGTPTDSMFIASASEIVAGESVNLNWVAINNADSATIDQGVGDVLLTGGTKTVSPTTTTTYTLLAKCSKSNQSLARTTTVTVKPALQITSATVLASPENFTGACPKEFTFTANVTATGTGDLTYKWVKSDGSSTAVKTFTFVNPGYALITDKWTPGASMSGWEKIVILTPNSLESNQASVTLTCQTAKDFSGSWYHNFGTANITQSGSSVTGTYYNAFSGKSGTIAGNVSGSTLTGTWSISGASGSLSLKIDADTFNGKFNDAFEWCGAKAGKNFPLGCGFAGKWNSQVGSVSDCSLNLTQKDNSVTGSYCNGTVQGTVSYSGSASEAMLTGNWVIGSTHGNIKFYLLNYDGNQFQGNYDTTYRWCGSRSGYALPSTCLR